MALAKFCHMHILTDGRQKLYKPCSFSIKRYLFCFSYTHNVKPKGKYIAFVSTDAETNNPKFEPKPGIDLLGLVDELFFETLDRFEPVNASFLDNWFISTSYDTTTHFESTVVDVLNMYPRSRERFWILMLI